MPRDATVALRAIHRFRLVSPLVIYPYQIVFQKARIESARQAKKTAGAGRENGGGPARDAH